MRSVGLALAAVGLLAGDAAAQAGAGTRAVAFTPLEQTVERPYRTEHCLQRCHGVPGFGAGGSEGALRELYVDAGAYRSSTHGQKGIECVDCHLDADPNWHPRWGFRAVDCRACHARQAGSELFPPDALLRLSEKGIVPPAQESLKGDDWMGTVHARAWAAGDPAAPFCSHCHTAHAVRRSDDPQATTHRSRLADTCGVCHVDQVRAYDLGGALARFRIAAHGKGDLSQRYGIDQCLSCHPAQGAHGEAPAEGVDCPTCHRVPEQRAEVTVASLHVRPWAGDQPLAGWLRRLYQLGFWTVAAGAALLALVAGFAVLYRRRPAADATGEEVH